MVYICYLAHISCHLFYCVSLTVSRNTFCPDLSFKVLFEIPPDNIVTMTVADIVVRRLLRNQLCLLWTVFALCGQKGLGLCDAALLCK